LHQQTLGLNEQDASSYAMVEAHLSNYQKEATVGAQAKECLTKPREENCPSGIIQPAPPSAIYQDPLNLVRWVMWTPSSIPPSSL
jgi:hypothetical protein